MFSYYPAEGTTHADWQRAIPSPKLRAVFDFANFVLDGEDPWVTGPLLKAQTAHIQVKDPQRADRKVVPAGAGDGRIADILKDAHANGCGRSRTCRAATATRSTARKNSSSG